VGKKRNRIAEEKGSAGDKRRVEREDGWEAKRSADRAMVCRSGTETQDKEQRVRIGRERWRNEPEPDNEQRERMIALSNSRKRNLRRHTRQSTAAQTTGPPPEGASGDPRDDVSQPKRIQIPEPASHVTSRDRSDEASEGVHTSDDAGSLRPTTALPRKHVHMHCPFAFPSFGAR
jgi:hypothetical protein